MTTRTMDWFINEVRFIRDSAASSGNRVVARCDSCEFWVHKDNDFGDCQRFPSKVLKYAYDWCGEWR